MRNQPSQPLPMLSSQPAMLERRVEDGGGGARLGRWPKVAAFAIGLVAAFVLNMFVGPRSAAWRSATSRQAEHASSAQAVASSAPTAASSSAVAPNGIEEKRAKARDAVRSKKRQPHKHRAASKR